MKRFKARSKMDVLKNVSMFSACTTKELGLIAQLVDEVEVPKGAVLTKEGTTGREAFVVADGTAKIAINGRRIATTGPGGIIGEMALLDQGPRSATATAETPMKLYVLDARSFTTLLDQVPPVARKVLRTLAQRLRDAEKAPTH
jgi:CRP-like cAMP-binding protein